VPAPERTVLIVDDEANLRKVLAAMLRREGYGILSASDGEEAWSLLKTHRVDVVLTDLRMPKIDGMTLLERITKERRELPVVMLTAHGTVDTAVTAMKLGAFDYLTKPFDQDELRVIIKKAADTAAKNDEEPVAEAVPVGRFGMIGQSPTLDDVFKIIEKVASSPSTVLITGESGTGKELIASALHHHSPRANKPFIKINCAAIPKDLIESELFGHEKGAFTGAMSSKPGRFELADEGTLFLDEIGTIPLEMQVKLLRALQESEFERVGGITTIRVNVRLIAATNADLKADAQSGRFREDLFYRLNVVPIILPPLRDRKDDIQHLVAHFFEKYNKRLGKKVERLSSEALDCLKRYSWPGNIRELENVIERGVLFAEGSELTKEELPNALRDYERESQKPLSKDTGDIPLRSPVGPLKEIVKQHTDSLEKDLIARALEETHGNVTKAARRLEISRKSLQNKMKDLGLREPADDDNDSNPPTLPPD
jgi:two-component system, NtrC family, response regulator AtoC